MKLDDLIKKESKAQQRERLQLTLDTVRANQEKVAQILLGINGWVSLLEAKEILLGMQKQDRDAILLPNAILTKEQITELGFGQEPESQERVGITTG